MNIRLLTIEDYDAVYSLWKISTGINLRTLDDSETGIRKFLERNPHTCFAAEENGELAGTILGGNDGRRGYIYHIAVKANFRNQGIGRSLIESVEKALIQEGINKVAMVSIKTNVGGNRFLRACGYPIREDIVYRNKNLNTENN
ncbi:GNAT family N-acetyltransferase [Treponema primitia]|uniref:GNAT family N-acetyltransferase n=1 Tax=Treponema primitia TaxID=88058 RepID=UPI0002554E86|nr:GNAT family N-acetyltransferase [Treponema primitia]